MIHESEPLRGIRVLFVDRDVESRETYAAALARAGAEVTAVASTSEAYGAFEQVRPDVLVADLGRDDEPDGVALVEWVRDLPLERGGETPAVAMTASHRNHERVRAIHSGFDQCLSRPVAPHELLSMLVRLVVRSAFMW